jgi:hypothetical protein
MTREEAKEFEYDLDVDGYYYKDVEKVIDMIYDAHEKEIGLLRVEIDRLIDEHPFREE